MNASTPPDILESLHVHGYTPVDLQLLRFVTRYAGTPIKWDIVTFFAENPYSRDVARNIAGRIGRLEGSILRELEDLALLGLLRRTRLAGDWVYGVSDAGGHERSLERFRSAFCSGPPV